MSDKSEHDGTATCNNNTSRRDFLGLVSAGAFVWACLMSFIGFIKLPKPALMPVASKTFKIGKPDKYPIGTRLLIKPRRVLVIRDEQGLYAISTVCTHLGCVVSEIESGFLCACHGSYFDSAGTVLSGPAPKSLEWFEINQLPNGVLAVNSGKTVKPGTTFKINA